VGFAKQWCNLDIQTYESIIIAKQCCV